MEIRIKDEFIKLGQALKLAGVDMSSPEPVRNALKIFKETIDQLKALKA